MSILTLSIGGQTLATIDVTRDGDSIYAAGDLTATGGNLYLHIDGKEFGSLFITYDGEDGVPTITLGQFDPETQDWETRAEIRAIPDEYQIKEK